MVNKPLIRPYFWGGYVRGGWLNSHEETVQKNIFLNSVVTVHVVFYILFFLIKRKHKKTTQQKQVHKFVPPKTGFARFMMSLQKN